MNLPQGNDTVVAVSPMDLLAQPLIKARDDANMTAMEAAEAFAQAVSCGSGSRKG